MMTQSNPSFDQYVDHGVSSDQQNSAPSPVKNTANPPDASNSQSWFGRLGSALDPFSGMTQQNVSDIRQQMQSPQQIKSMVNASAGAPGMALEGAAAPLLGIGSLSDVPGAAKAGLQNTSDYFNTGQEAEDFRNTLGQGTSKENIGELAKRTQFAKQSALQEALIPKEQIYSQEGKSDIYNVNQSQLPEGNMQQMGSMFDPGANQFSPDKMDALSSALKQYRKSGDVGSFMDKSEDIFNVPDLPDSAASKIEDALSMPTKRDSAYFSDPNVDSFYGNKGNLQQLHDQFQDKPTLNNYDPLQSALKTRQRTLNSRYNNGTISDTGEAELNQLNSNITNLDSDSQNFMQTLPENMQNLEKDFRTKYATGAAQYENAPLTIRNLANPKNVDQVTSSQVGKAFTSMTPQTMKVLQDMGPSAGNNILYNALQKVQPGDAEGLANSILDLKRTKGYDQFVTPDQEQWANNMLSHIGTIGKIKNVLKTGLGAVGGYQAGSSLGIGGLTGAAIGGTLAHAPTLAKYLVNKIKK
jgi:hypothetical protein